MPPHLKGATKLGHQYGISCNAVLRLVEEAGVPRKQRMGEDEVRGAVRLFEQGHSLASVKDRVVMILAQGNVRLRRTLQLLGIYYETDN